MYRLIISIAVMLANTNTEALVFQKAKQTKVAAGPRFDKSINKWVEDKPTTGYGPIGTLFRAGPKPFIQRLLSTDDYEQAVLKFMAMDKCSRDEAQGNMDAYFENPMDWTYQKIEEQRGKPKKNYATANMDPKQLVLSGTWASIVLIFFYTFISDCLAGKYPVKTLF